MDTEREELKVLIESIGPSLRLANAILDAGYRKRRTINTAWELDELSDGAVIIDKFGDVSQLRGGEWCGYETAPLNSRTIAKWLPATVLSEG